MEYQKDKYHAKMNLTELEDKFLILKECKGQPAILEIKKDNLQFIDKRLLVNFGEIGG